MKTKQMMMEELNEMKIFNENKFTYIDYVSQLKGFEQYALKEYYKDEYNEKLRINDLHYIMRQDSFKYDLANNPEYLKCIDGLNFLNKEISISMAGKVAEDKVNTLLDKYITREDYKRYLNVNVSTTDDESEIDNIILTKHGLILLEVKGAKSDIKITKEGRLVHGNEASYDKEPAVIRMKNKRKMFRETLQKVLNEKGYDVDIVMDSYLVFVLPNRSTYYIRDDYKNQKWCKHTKLTYIINEYTSDFIYTEDELKMLNECLLSMEVSKKTFDTTRDLVQLKDEVITGLAILNERKNPKVEVNTEKTLKTKKRFRQSLSLGFLSIACCAAAVFALTEMN